MGQWAQQGVGRQRGGGGSRQGIDSRTNACNFITNLGMSFGGHLWGCSQAIWLHAGRLPGGLGQPHRQGRGERVPFREAGDPTLFWIGLWERGADPYSFPVFWEQPPPSISVIVRERI